MFSFTLSRKFVDSYADRPVDWGYRDAAGNTLGEITFLRTYSRLKPDGSKERWHEVCERVINGMYSIHKDWVLRNRLPWDEAKAQRSAREAYDRMFALKWTPPGRGLWVMGTPIVHKQGNSAPLQNCAFISTADMTKDDPAGPFAFLMEASMLGVGVGLDTEGAKKGFKIRQPLPQAITVQIPDTREGWVESVVFLLESYLLDDGALNPTIEFDYSRIRPEGSPIKTFGGTAAGPRPLRELHEALRRVLDGRDGERLTTVDIADIANLIGVCVVSGNVRRSAELIIGDRRDEDFLNLKNPEVFPARNSYDPDAPGWAWMSNNSVRASVKDDLSAIVPGIVRNGEPGVVWLDLIREYGRLIDPPTGADFRVAGVNPCAEQGLESGEMCTLSEVYLNRHDSIEDFHRTLKFAYLYAKTVTLLPTHWEKTNAIMARNRRIGLSISGQANFADKNGLVVLREWQNTGYEVVQRYDDLYSEWLTVRPSIKTTTVKPSGTVSILAGESPGVHWTPGGEFFERRIRFRKDDPMVALFREAGYLVEPASEDPVGTVVVAFPIHSDAHRSEKDVTIFEKANLAVLAQRYWSDNAVSVTLSFDPEKEGADVGRVLQMHAGQLKTVSFLPMATGTYPQMPYTESDHDRHEAAALTLSRVDFGPIYSGAAEAEEAEGEAFCTTDVCEMRPLN